MRDQDSALVHALKAALVEADRELSLQGTEREAGEAWLREAQAGLDKTLARIDRLEELRLSLQGSLDELQQPGADSPGGEEAAPGADSLSTPHLGEKLAPQAAAPQGADGPEEATAPAAPETSGVEVSVGLADSLDRGTLQDLLLGLLATSERPMQVGDAWAAIERLHKQGRTTHLVGVRRPIETVRTGFARLAAKGLVVKTGTSEYAVARASAEAGGA